MNTKYLKIIQSANANGVTIYTLDATGLSTPDVMSADNRQMRRPGQRLHRSGRTCRGRSA